MKSPGWDVSTPWDFFVYQDPYCMEAIPGGCSDRVRSTSRNQVHLLVGKTSEIPKRMDTLPMQNKCPAPFSRPEAQEFSYLNASGGRTAGHFEVR